LHRFQIDWWQQRQSWITLAKSYTSKRSDDTIIKDSLAACAQAKFVIDRIADQKPYAIEYRIIQEKILQIRDNLIEMLGPRDEEPE
jgi:hypothetical protein